MKLTDDASVQMPFEETALETVDCSNEELTRLSRPDEAPAVAFVTGFSTPHPIHPALVETLRLPKELPTL